MWGDGWGLHEDILSMYAALHVVVFILSRLDLAESLALYVYMPITFSDAYAWTL